MPKWVSSFLITNLECKWNLNNEHLFSCTAQSTVYLTFSCNLQDSFKHEDFYLHPLIFVHFSISCNWWVYINHHPSGDMVWNLNLTDSMNSAGKYRIYILEHWLCNFFLEAKTWKIKTSFTNSIIIFVEFMWNFSLFTFPFLWKKYMIDAQIITISFQHVPFCRY